MHTSILQIHSIWIVTNTIVAIRISSMHDQTHVGISSSFGDVQEAVEKHRLNVDICLVLHPIGVLEVVTQGIELLCKLCKFATALVEMILAEREARKQ